MMATPVVVIANVLRYDSMQCPRAVLGIEINVFSLDSAPEVLNPHIVQINSELRQRFLYLCFAMADKTILKPFDIFLIIGVIVCNIVYYIASGEIDYLGFAAAVTGIVNVVLCARAHLLNYAFGIVNVSIMAIIYFLGSTWGNAVLYGAYFLPMNVVGLISWKKNLTDDQSGVIETKRLTARQRLVWGAVSIAFVVGGVYLLRLFNGNEPVLDSISTIISVVAMVMLVKAYMEQWWLWLFINIVYVALWTRNVIVGTPHSVSTLIMYIFYTLNSINGLIIWQRLSKK